MRHRCYAGRDGWQTCTDCDGRIHAGDCTTKPDPKKDCCIARHLEMGKPPNTAQVRPESAARKLGRENRAVLNYLDSHQ